MPSLNILIEFFSSFSLTFLMQTQMDALTCLKTRRSIRQFTENPISDEILTEILECETWSPSGINHQPWKVYVIRDQELKNALAGYTDSGNIIMSAPGLFVIYLDKSSGYNYTKSVQSIGAFFRVFYWLYMLLGIRRGMAWPNL